jgi:LysM repeat protein
MALEKAVIEIEGGEEITVLFNPNQYSLEKSNQLAEIGIPGLGAPIVQFVRGNTDTLSMDLFIDTYEDQKDVREYTDKVYELLEIDQDTHVPPICIFRWGTFEFRGVLARVSGKFTLFLENGLPARATLSVSFKQFIDVEVEVKESPTHSADHYKTCVVKQGDSLSSIAAAEYDDPAIWRPLADKNRIANPRDLKPGQRLVIPPLT